MAHLQVILQIRNATRLYSRHFEHSKFNKAILTQPYTLLVAFWELEKELVTECCHSVTISIHNKPTYKQITPKTRKKD